MYVIPLHKIRVHENWHHLLSELPCLLLFLLWRKYSELFTAHLPYMVEQ